MNATEVASKITEAGSAKVEQQKPPAIDEAVVNKVIKQGATALASGVSRGDVDPAVGAAAEVACVSVCMPQCAVFVHSVLTAWGVVTMRYSSRMCTSLQRLRSEVAASLHVRSAHADQSMNRSRYSPPGSQAHQRLKDCRRGQGSVAGQNSDKARPPG